MFFTFYRSFIILNIQQLTEEENSIFCFQYVVLYMLYTHCLYTVKTCALNKCVYYEIISLFFVQKSVFVSYDITPYANTWMIFFKRVIKFHLVILRKGWYQGSSVLIEFPSSLPWYVESFFVFFVYGVWTESVTIEFRFVPSHIVVTICSR